MKKPLGWTVAVLGVVLLFSAVSLSAQTERSTSQTQGQLAANIIAVPSALPSGVLSILGHAIYLMDGDDWKKSDDDSRKMDRDWHKWGDNDGDGDGDKDDHHKKYHHDPTPEPSTLLSFGAAILIGGAVIYSRRLRKSK